MTGRRQNRLHRCVHYTTEPHNRLTRGRRCRSLITSAVDGRVNGQATLRDQDANREKAGETSFSPFGSVIKLALAESGDACGAGRLRVTAADQQRPMSATTNSNTSETDREEIAIASYGVLSQNDEKTTPFCSCLGCRNEADVVIDHPEHGRRVVCGECARSFEVMDHV